MKTRKMILALVLIVTILSTMAIPAFALAGGDTIEYPLRKENAFENSPIWKGPTAPADVDAWYLAEVLFDAGPQDITNASYIGIEIRNVAGNPGMTFGVLCGASRWATYIDGESKAFFIKQDGSVQALNVLYQSINLGNEPGMLLLPISSLSEVGWGNGTPLSVARSFFLETNGRFNWNWEVQFGEVGLYTGEIGSGSFQKLTDLSAEKKGAFACYAGELVFPEPPAPEKEAKTLVIGDKTYSTDNWIYNEATDAAGASKLGMLIYDKNYEGEVVTNGWGGAIVLDKYGKLVKIYDGANVGFWTEAGKSTDPLTFNTSDYSTVAFSELADGEMLIVFPHSGGDPNPRAFALGLRDLNGDKPYCGKIAALTGFEFEAEPVDPPVEPEIPDAGDTAIFFVLTLMTVAMAAVVVLTKKQVR